MKIIGILLLIAGIGIGVTEKEYGPMALGIVLGAFLIWYSPKAKAKAEVRKKERQRKAMQKMFDNMTDEELQQLHGNLDNIENKFLDISDNLEKIGDEMIETMKKD